MIEPPDIRFARAAGSSIAYQVYGDGPVTICAVPPMAQNIELAWDSPVLRRMFERFGSFSRQVVFDKRGTGMSDRSLKIPALDERVDELRAVMDAAGVEHAYLHGISEGGPMAIMFAATYPERVDGLVLEGTAASLANDEQREAMKQPGAEAQHTALTQAFADAWGTTESITLSIFGPSLLENAEFAAWWPRYERQAANRDALLELFRMNTDMDARDVVGRVECPILILHRTDDLVVSIDEARDTFRRFDEAGAEVKMVELPGHDHFTFAGDTDSMVDEIERFVTGTVTPRSTQRDHRVEIRTMGRFEVLVDGSPVSTSAWGSKRARTLLKRLVAARGWPVTRDELIEMLWPDETSDRLGARLSVQLSAVRRILHGSVTADRSTIRLDLDAVVIDVEDWFGLDDPKAIVEAYHGDFLETDPYDDWAAPLRSEMRDRFVTAARQVIKETAESAEDDGDEKAAEFHRGLMRRLLEVDPFDESVHGMLIQQLHADGRAGEAAAAHQRYVELMAELEVPARTFDDIIRESS